MLLTCEQFYRPRGAALWFAGTLLFNTNVVCAATLTIGSLSETPDAELSIFLPVANYLVAALGKEGYDNARVVVRKTHAEMAGLMKRGDVDLFIDSSLSALKVQRLSGGEFLARRWKKGIGEYRSVIFVRKASPVQNLGALAGRSIAFEEPYSTSGYLLPAGELRQHGLNLIQSEKGKIAKAVSYRFTYGEENTLLWVLGGRADAGAMADYVFKKLSAPVSEDLRVIHQSNAMPYHVVVTRPGLSSAIRRAVHGRLLAMHQNPQGQKILQTFEATTRFDDIPAASLHNLSTFKLDF